MLSRSAQMAPACALSCATVPSATMPDLQGHVAPDHQADSAGTALTGRLCGFSTSDGN